MRYVIDTGKERRSINFIDNICFSEVKDAFGNAKKLYLSLMLQNGNSEMRLADGRDDEVSTGKQPVIVWINGAGWRQCDKNLMAAEMEFLAEHGYAVACIDYRKSDEGVFPAQLQDVKTAVRFLRTNAEQYGLDPDRFGTIGRSAGGHLSSWMAMNTDGYDTEEWGGADSTVSACVDLFGPVDIKALNLIEQERFKDPEHRWHQLKETHGGALVGGESDEEILSRSDAASPHTAIGEKMAPLLIMHGDQDPLVPLKISETFYQRIVEKGFGDRADFYILKHAGHGTREFFQTATKRILLDFFDRYLKE